MLKILFLLVPVENAPLNCMIDIEFGICNYYLPIYFYFTYFEIKFLSSISSVRKEFIYK